MSWKDLLKDDSPNFDWSMDRLGRPSKFFEKYMVLKRSLYDDAKNTPYMGITYSAFKQIEEYLDEIDNEHDLYDKGVPYIAFKISSLSSREWTKERIEQLFSGLF